MKSHPEQQDDEVYLGNTTEKESQQSNWRTSRLGSKNEDRLLKFHEDTFPWFVKKSEIISKIEYESQFPWGEDWKNAPQPLLDE